MNTIDLFSKERVKFDLEAKTKEQVIDELIEILDKDGKLIDKAAFKEAVLKREEEFSTGIGMGIAIPHGKSDAVKEPAMVFGRSNEGIDYESMDEKKAFLFFLIAVPEKSSDLHLKALAEISRKLMHKEIKEQLMTCETYDCFIEAIS